MSNDNRNIASTRMRRVLTVAVAAYLILLVALIVARIAQEAP